MTPTMTDAVLDDPAALADYAADWLVQALLAQPGPLGVALSGGSTPRLLYERLARRDDLPWGRVHWFWGDERFVAPDDPRSNEGMARRAMLGRAAPGTVHPVPTGAASPEAAAREYQSTLQAFYGGERLGNRPLFHVVLLGLGTNGHTASLFPGTPSLDERDAWATAVRPEGEEPRITLTYPALESCRHAVFLVTGGDKRDVLAAVRAGDQSLPAARLHPAGTLHWFTDRAAAPAAL